ncbi:MAG TPA: glycosyltransferase family 39 protein, partial [Thermoanaerobaculia bacterium]|nr:glycosyltransferase family 39 protein [Thermoanaerobaculia bacterium]
MADPPAPKRGGGLSLLGGLSRRRRDDLLLALAGLLLFLPGIGRRDLWNPDEPRYAEVAREMRLSGEYLVPHLNGQVYAHKPPLQFWAIAAAALVRGKLDEVATRLPAVASAVAAMLLVSRLGERLFNRRAAWIAVAAFATCAKILWQGRIGQIDMLLTALVAAAVWFWVRSWTEERPNLALLFFLFAGLATLAKGPVGLLPPLLGILALLAVERDRQGFRRLRLGRGLLLWAAVVLAWLVPAGLHAGRDYLDQIVLRQNVTRFADPWHHFRPWHYYLSVLPGDFFPWSLLLPGALVAGWKGLAGRERRHFVLTLCWAAATLVFFSLSPAKRTVYILTMYPALALAVGAGLDRIA